MSSIGSVGGSSTQYIIHMNQLRAEAGQQAAQREELAGRYRQSVTDGLLSQRLETVQQMLDAGKVEFKTGLVVHTTA